MEKIDIQGILSGAPDRDAHPRNADFLNVANYPATTFIGSPVGFLGVHDYTIIGDFTIRGATRRATLNVSFLG